MRRSCYETRLRQLEAERDEAFNTLLECATYRGESSIAAFDMGDEISVQRLETEMERKRRQEEYAAAQQSLDVIKAQIVELDQKVKAEGFDYERPGSKFVNRLLPPAPTGAKELPFMEPIQYHHPRWLAWYCGVLVALTSTVSLGFMPRWFMSGLLYVVMGPASDTVQGVSPVFSAIILAATLVLLVLSLKRPTFSQLRRELHVQARFIYGAEEWTMRQRLQSCAVYGVASIGTFVVPLLIVPLRFCQLAVTMALYVRRQRETDCASALASSAGFVVATMRSAAIVVCVAGVIIFTALLILL